MDVQLSVIIPSFNEAERLPPFLTDVRAYLDDRYADSHEVIIVDDGSTDGTADALGPWTTDWPNLSTLRHPSNRGKGAAVRTGMLAARGRLLLFTDADGATPIDQEAKLAEAIDAGADLAIGSRLLAADGVTRRRTKGRALAGRAFAALARRMLGIAVLDTQCGFKMFRHGVGQKLFQASQETGYLFDLELLVLAARMNYTVAEVPVNWSDIPGGHLSPLAEAGRVLTGLLRLRRHVKQNT